MFKVIAFIEATDIFEFGPYATVEYAWDMVPILKEDIVNIMKIKSVPPEDQIPVYEKDLEYRVEKY